MKINKIILILAIAFTGLSCQAVKDGLSGGKSENSDEFLVKKKSPLVLPPKYLKLPNKAFSGGRIEIIFFFPFLLFCEKNILVDLDFILQK